jgi:Pyridoxamine 5'-phosphate oxidase
MKTKNIDAPSKDPVQEWRDVAAELDKGAFMSLDNEGPSHYTTWLTTLNADGSPHVTAVGAVWDGDNLWFQTADQTHKAKNIVRDQRCALSVTLDGCDVVVEGTAEKVTDPGEVARIADIFETRGGWPAKPDESGTGITAPFNAPGLGPPPWFLYRISPTAATSVSTTGEEGGSTRWTF